MFDRYLSPQPAAIRLLALFCCVAFSLFFTGCSKQSHTPTETTNSGLRAFCFDIASDRDDIHLMYGEPNKNKGLDFFYLKRNSADESWPEPINIPTSHSVPGNHHRGNDPQIAVDGERIMALWTAKGGGPFGSGPIATALSSDGGKSWRPGPSPTVGDEGKEDVGYRFPATVAGDSAFHVVWIHAEGEHRSLRYSRLPFDADKWSVPTVIDSTSCACCWNELKIGSDGKLFVLYRDEKPRDMAFASSNDSGQTWARTGPVGDFAWDFNGCPHVGGGLALAGNQTGKNLLVATVWTGHTNHSGAYVLTSHDNGLSWSDPKKLGASKIGRHTDTAPLSTDRAVAAWDEPTTEGQGVFFAGTADGGITWSQPKQISASQRSGRYPRLIACGERIFAFWTEEEASGTPLLRVEILEVSSDTEPTKRAAISR